MKLGILIDRLNVGGVEKIALEQVRALRAKGIDAHLIVMREKSLVDKPFPDLVNKVPIIYLDSRLPSIFKLSFKFPFFYFFSLFHVTYPLFLPFVVKRHEFDYIFAHGTYTSFTAIMLKKVKGIHFSAFIWDPASYILERVYKQRSGRLAFLILGKLMLMADKLVIGQMDHVLVGGDAHNKFIKAINSDKKIITIYPSVHPVKKIAKKEPYIQMATAWKRGKNPEYVIELAKELPGFRIKMVGKWLEPDYYKQFMDLVKNNNLENQIEVLGEVTESKLADTYRKAQVVLQTNDDRGFGMPALEAAGNGTTFVIPRGQGVCKLFTNNVDGYYVKEKDTKQIAKYIEELFNNPARAKKMSENAWKKAVDNYSWDVHATKLQKLAIQATKK